MHDRATERHKALWYIGTGALTLAWVGLTYSGTVFGYVAPIPFLILYAIVVLSPAMLGIVAGVISGSIAAVFVQFSYAVGFGPETLTGTFSYSLLGSALYLGTGILVGILRRAADTARSSQRAMIDENIRRLDESEERYNQAVRAVNDGVWDWNVKTNQMFLSQRFYEILGYGPDELNARLQDVIDLVDARDRERIDALIESIRAGKRERFETQARMHQKSGETITVLVRGTLIRQDGEPVRVVGTMVDVTERLKVMEMLDLTEEMLNEGLQALPIGFAFFDQKKGLLLFNESYQKYVPARGHLLRKGMRFEELVRATSTDLASSQGFADTESYITARVRAATRGGGPWHHSMRDGKMMRMTEHPTRSGGFISLIEDVTEERKSEMRTRQMQRLEVIGQLTGGIAHDFNNVLAVIQSSAELQRLSESSDPGLVDQVLRAVRRGSDLTRRLLAYARRQTLAPATIDCGALVAGMGEVLGRTLGETIRLSVEVPDDLWSARADPSQVEDALMNLAINARDAMPEGGRLTIGCRNLTLPAADETLPPDGAPGDYVQLTVSDTGTGMAPEIADRAIEPFFTTKSFGKGSGLGLSMVYGFARQSGGHLRIESATGRGTSVHIYLPRDNATGRVVSRPLSRQIPKGQGESVLVIEDDPLVRDLVVRTVSGLSYVPTAAENAAAAKALLSDGHHFDIILCDVVLPGAMSGPAFVRSLGDSYPAERVIFMSGYPEDEVTGDGIDQSKYVLLQKPFGRENLASALQTALTHIGARGAA